MLATPENFHQLPTYMSEQVYGAFLVADTIAIVHDVDRLEAIRNEIFNAFDIKAPIIPPSKTTTEQEKLGNRLNTLERLRAEIIQTAPNIPLRNTTLVYYDIATEKPLTADRGGPSSYMDAHILTMPGMNRPTPLSPTSIVASTEGVKRGLLEIGIDIQAERLVYDFARNILFPWQEPPSGWNMRRKRDKDKRQDEKQAYLDEVEARHGDAIILEKAKVVAYEPPHQHTEAEEVAYRKLLKTRRPDEELAEKKAAEKKAKEEEEVLKMLARRFFGA